MITYHSTPSSQQMYSAKPEGKLQSTIREISEHKVNSVFYTEETSAGLDSWTTGSPISLTGSDSTHTVLNIPLEDQYHVELMLRHIYNRAKSNEWFLHEKESPDMRVALRASEPLSGQPAFYLTAPVSEQSDDGSELTLLDLAGYLQCEVMLAMTSKTTSMLMSSASPSVKSIALDEFTHVQIIDRFEDFMSIRKAQSAAFIRDDETLLIWSDSADTILRTGIQLEEKMVTVIWDGMHDAESGSSLLDQDEDLEKSEVEEKRSTSIIISVLVALAILAISVFIGQDLHEVVLQIKADGNYRACLIVIYFPFMSWLAAFFAQTFAVLVMQLLGPVSHLTSNTKFYSGMAPKKNFNQDLPHITIQCPLYLEDLDTVLKPAFRSVREAIKTYEMQGGTANFFVNDDGLQVLNPDESAKRLAFYAQHEIGYIARPPSGKDGFVRAGKFKKASNMNYALALSYELEERLGKLDRSGDWTDLYEKLATTATLQTLLREQTPQAMGGGDVRIGDLILLIDADTRIPADCFLDAANEFLLSPDVAILQHTSLAFRVVDNYWEDCMAYFTMFVSEAMRYMTASGDVCPFIGHNAFIRWSALQEVCTKTEHCRQWWSEHHVSEDFELSMKLQNLGYTVRMAAYTKGAFKEGVSLSVYDEFNRWQKYAFGISELCFHPLRHWPVKGPFTSLFRAFLSSSNIPLASKVTMLAYMGSYYAIASSWILALLNYILTGWFSVTITRLYQSSFQIMIATLIVYDVATPIVNGLYRYRSRQSPLAYAIYENFKWILLLFIFFGGLSLHVTQSLVWHLLGIPLSWESTAKSLESSYFFKEVPMIWRRYKYLYLILALMSILQIVLASSTLPEAWRIVPSVFATLPLVWVTVCHALAPLLLNPQSWLSELHM